MVHALKQGIAFGFRYQACAALQTPRTFNIERPAVVETQFEPIDAHRDALQLLADQSGQVYVFRYAKQCVLPLCTSIMYPRSLSAHILFHRPATR